MVEKLQLLARTGRPTDTGGELPRPQTIKPEPAQQQEGKDGDEALHTDILRPFALQREQTMTNRTLVRLVLTGAMILMDVMPLAIREQIEKRDAASRRNRTDAETPPI